MKSLEFKNKVTQAVEMFVTRDSELLDLWTHEQAMSHRIAVYLESLFPTTDANIDCEYNKHVNDSKKVSINVAIPDCEMCNCNACRKIVERGIDVLDEIYFRPDIVVHSRETDDNNKIVIEIKKDRSCPFDAAKLRALTISKERTGSYHYTLGVAVFFTKDHTPRYRWFVDGEEVLSG